MRKWYKYILILVFLAYGAYTIVQENNKSDISFFERVLLFGLYYFVCLALGIALIRAWYKCYLSNRRIISLLPILLPVLFLGVMLFIVLERKIKEGKPVFFEASSYDGVTLELRTDSTYRIKNYGLRDGRSYYGKFNFSGDTIILENVNRRTSLISQRLLIKDKFNDRVLKTDTGIYQLNSSGAILKDELILGVYVDKRRSY
jgi:hypothetical protein